MTLQDPGPWLLVVAAAHLGFQATVDVLVYPALGEVPDGQWAQAHRRHSRRISPLVALLYPALVLVVAWALVADPDDPGTWLAAAGAAVAVVSTAAVAAPTHGRLASATVAARTTLWRRLMLADRVRTLGAAVCLAGALLSVG